MLGITDPVAEWASQQESLRKACDQAKQIYLCDGLIDSMKELLTYEPAYLTRPHLQEASGFPVPTFPAQNFDFGPKPDEERSPNKIGFLTKHQIRN